MEKLEILALKKVCNNLELYYLLCKKNLWKVPSNLAYKILTYLIENTYELNEKNLKFFHKDIVSLSKICLHKKFEDNIEFFLTIDKKSITEINDFYLNSNNEIDEKIMENLLKNTKNLIKLSIRGNYSTDIVYKLLENSSNNIKEISIRKMNNPSSLKLLSKCTNIENIKVYNTTNSYLNNFDISKTLLKSYRTLRHLTFFVVDMNFEFDNLMITINDFLNLETIQFISVKNFPRTILEFFLNYSNKNNTLKKINLSRNYLLLDIYSDLQFFSQFFLNIEELSLNYSESGNFCSNLFSDDIDSVKFKYLKILNFISCKIDEKDFKIIGNILNNCFNIEKINFNSTNSYDNRLSYVFNGLNNSKSNLRILFLEKCSLKEHDAYVLAKLLQKCSSIEKLRLSYNSEIGIDHFGLIFSALKNSYYSLVQLKLDNCSIDDSLCPKLEEILINSIHLNDFSMNNNEISENGLIQIFHGLSFRKNNIQSGIFLKSNKIMKSLWEDLIKFFYNFQRIDKIQTYIKHPYFYIVAEAANLICDSIEIQIGKFEYTKKIYQDFSNEMKMICLKMTEKFL